MYPYSLTVKDEEMMNIFRLLSKRRGAYVRSKPLSNKLGWTLKDIREDIFIGSDGKYRRSYIGLGPNIDCEIKDFDKHMKVIFKNIF